MVASVGPVGAGGSQHILHVFRAPVGGLFRHVMDLTRLQAAAGHKVGIVCDSTTGGERAIQQLEDLRPHLALGITRLPMRRNPHVSDLRSLNAVCNVAERVRATVLHGHGAKGGLYARLAPAELEDGRSPIRTYTPHGGSYNYRPGSPLHRLYMGVEWLLARRTDVFLFESEYVASRHAQFVGRGGGLVRIVCNGIADSEFAPIPPAPQQSDLVYIGELREAKGIPYLLDALAILHAQGRPLSLLMVGSGPDEEALRASVGRLGLGKAVTFEPQQPIRTVLARSRVMVVPSLAESLPYVVLEAAAAQQPLVATNVGGIPEIFGASARELIPSKDAGALATAIAGVIDEPAESLKRRTEELSAFVHARFSLTRMGKDVLSGYAAGRRARMLQAGIAITGSEVASKSI